MSAERDETIRRAMLEVNAAVMDTARASKVARADAADRSLPDALGEAAQHVDKLFADCPHRSLIFVPEMVAIELLVSKGGVVREEAMRDPHVQAVHAIMFKIAYRAGTLEKPAMDPSLLASMQHGMAVARRMAPDLRPYALFFMPELIGVAFLVKRAVLLGPAMDDPDYRDLHNAMDAIGHRCARAQDDVS